MDEVNRIEAGKNYGWPEIRGDETIPGMETPLRHSGSVTWAPSGAAFLNGSFFFGGLAGQALYEAVIQASAVTEVRERFKGQFGRVRDVVAGPDGRLYITTSNRDGRGNPGPNDDRIIRVDPSDFLNARRLF
jgi:glucose/arabinose dehydrogenase